MTRPLSVALAGLGTVGIGVLELLRRNADVVAARAGRPVAVAAGGARAPRRAPGRGRGATPSPRPTPRPGRPAR